MAEASSSRRDEYDLTKESSGSEDERKISNTSSRRHAHYGTQRVSRSSRLTSGESQMSSKSTGKGGGYQHPAAFANLDEQAVPPPVNSSGDKATDRRQSGLEDTIREPRPTSEGPKAAKSPHQSQQARKRRSKRHDSQDLTEIAAPPPIQKPPDDGAAQPVGNQPSLEDEEGDEDDSDEPPPFQQRSPGDYLLSKDQEAEVPKYLTELYTISYLIFFAILGTLARLGVQWITFYPGTPVVTPVIWANFGGSLVMGFLSEDQSLFQERGGKNASNGIAHEKNRGQSSDGKDLQALNKAEHTKRKKTIPLYIGLATGFCGSFTSFSSFARDFFLALSNNLPTPINHPHPGSIVQHTTSTVSRNGGYSFEAFLHIVILTLALSLGGLILGAQMAILLVSVTPRIHASFIKKVVDRLMIPLGFGCWLGAVFLAIWPPNGYKNWRGEVIFALVFAPLGCLLRFYASMKLNGLVPAFPLGTFAVNMLGTAIEGMCYDIQHVEVGIMGKVGGGVLGCQVLQGLMDGFCGCLTTVSTWVAEINGLKRKHGWSYAFGSILGGLCLMVVVMGSVRWSVGFQNAVCNTGYTSKVHG